MLCSRNGSIQTLENEGESEKEGISENGGEIERRVNSENEGDKTELPAKKKRGRPRKVVTRGNILIPSGADNSETQTDLELHTLIARIRGDPQNYMEVMRRPDWQKWAEAKDKKLETMPLNKIFQIPPIRKTVYRGRKDNILDVG